VKVYERVNGMGLKILREILNSAFEREVGGCGWPKRRK